MTRLADREYADNIVRTALCGEEVMLDGTWLRDFEEALRERQVDLDGMMSRLVDRLASDVSADRCTIYLLDHARQQLVSRIAHLPEIREIRLGLGQGVAGRVAQSGVPLRVPSEDERIDPSIDAQTGYRTKSVLACPIVDGDVVLGVVQLLNKPGGFGVDDEAGLVRLCEHLGRLLVDSSLGSQLRPEHRQPLAFRFNHIVGESAAMQAVYDRTDRAARTDATVLLRGESGTGKELIARAVHCNSPREARPFVKVDCAALPGNLIENELFGHEKGAYTGADARAEGKVAAAEGGTLFLDEIGELDVAVQGKLLRLLQDRTYLRVGGTAAHQCDVRFVCATNRALEEMVEQGAFRRDLYYRVRVVEIVLPALRERGGGDLDRLVDHFLFLYKGRHGRPELVLGHEARAALHAHSWPGNVRELQHCIEAAVVMASGSEIARDVLSLGGPAVQGEPSRFHTTIRPLAEMQRDYIQHVLDHCDGNRTRAAQVLGIGRNTLLRKLED